MNWLEARFRRKFVPQGEDFLFQDANATVIFDREQVESLVADWPKYWLSPLFWGVMLIAAGWAAASFAFDLWTGNLILASLLADLVLICGAVMLWVVQRGPSELAHTLPSAGPGNGRPEYWHHLSMLVLALLWLGFVRSDGYWWGNWPLWLWGAVALYHAWQLARYVWRQRLKPAA